MKIRTVKNILAGLCAAALLVGCGLGYANSSTSNQMYEGAAADYSEEEATELLKKEKKRP